MIRDYFILSFKNLKHRGIRSWLTLLGIFIGITAVVSLISLGNGLEMAVSSQFGISQTELITIEATSGGFGPPGQAVINPLTSKEYDAVSKVNGVKRIAKRYIQSSKLEYNDKVVFGYAISIPSGENRKFIYEQIGDKTEVGRLLKDSDVKKVVLGYNFYVDKVGLDKPVVPGKKVLVQDKEFKVVGIAEKQGSFIFDNVVMMNDDDIEDLFNIGDEMNMILVQPKDVDEMDRLKSDIERTLRRVRDVKEGEEDFSVETPESSLATLKGILGGVQAFIIIVASISIFIGALGIVNTMTTSVIERKREIGIMKSIGARNAHIFMQFFIESSLLGLIGGLVGALFGTLIGILGTVGINSWLGTTLTPDIDFALIFFALFGSFIVGGIAGIVPAMRASKQNPVDALRS